MGSIIKVKREFAPKDFSLEIESFSRLAYACNKPETAKYESVVFSPEGYSWKLQLYPNGNTKSHGNDHISLYLAIVDLPSHQEVHVELKFFVFDKKKDNYLMIQDGGTKRFHEAKTEWGYDKLMSLAAFKDPNSGYLVKDHCEFGVEIFKLVCSETEKRQTWSIVKPDSSPLPVPFKRTFKGFSKMLDKDFYYADTPITFGDQTWKVQLYPKGFAEAKGNSLSLFLELVDAAKIAPGKQVWAEFKLRVMHPSGKHVEHTVQHWYNCLENRHGWGCRKFMPLGARKGFVVNDDITVEVEFIDVSVTKVN